MALAAHNLVVQDTSGNGKASAQVEVRRESDNGLASIYSDRAGATPKSNPFNCDSSGRGSFYVVGGAYKITATYAGGTDTQRYVAIGLAAEYDLASDTASGVAELATTSEAQTGTDTARTVTPAGLRAATREKLTGSRTYYVRTDGSNSNTGLANTSGGAFLTIQKAIDTIYTLDIGTNSVTISVADGTYTGSIVLAGPWLGSGTVSLVGNTSTPANVLLSTSSETIWAKQGAALTISGIELRSSAASALYCTDGGKIIIGSAVRFGTTNYAHMFAEYGGIIYSRSAYEIVGNATFHYLARSNATVDVSGLTCTIATARAFTTFARADFGSVLLAYINTYSGAGVAGTTGQRYLAETNALVYTLGGGASYFPGNSAGSENTGGRYV